MAAGRSGTAEAGDGMQADSGGRALRESVLQSVTHALLPSDFTWPKQGLQASGALSPSGWTWSPRTEAARGAGSWCGNRGPRGLIGGWVDVGTRQWGWVEGHRHGGSHSGKALGQGGGQPPPEPSFLWSWGAEDLWALLVHLYHLGEDTGPSEPRGPGTLVPFSSSLVCHHDCWEAVALVGFQKGPELTRDRTLRPRTNPAPCSGS